MQIVFHVLKFYDWVPVPDDVKVTPADLSSDRVRPAANGGYRMRVTRQGPTQTTVHLPEEQVIAKIIDERTSPSGGRVLGRKEAIAFYLGTHILPLHAHRTWITKIELDYSDPDEEMCRRMLAPHGVSESGRVKACMDAGVHKVEGRGDGHPERCSSCGHMPKIGEPSEESNIPLEEHAAHVAAYMAPCSADDFVKHLHTHFKVKGAQS